MSIPGKNADLIRRFKLYGFGLLLGTLIVSFMYKGKGCQMPGSAKMEELSWQQLQYSEVGECITSCKQISKEEIKNILKTGKVNYDESDVRAKPFPVYAIEGKLNKGKHVRMLIVDVDTVSTLAAVFDLNIETGEVMADSCSCQ